MWFNNISSRHSIHRHRYAQPDTVSFRHSTFQTVNCTVSVSSVCSLSCVPKADTLLSVCAEPAGGSQGDGSGGDLCPGPG